MQTAQQQVEEWLTETVARTIYLGNEMVPRLQRISESLRASDENAQEFIRQWVDTTEDAQTVYRAKEVQNKLLDLWGLVTDFQKLVDEESLSPSAV